MKEVLVTGANGFLGRALLRVLEAQGLKPLALVRREEAALELRAKQPGLDVRVADLGVASSIERAMEGSSPTWVFHLGGGRVASAGLGLRDNLAANVVPTVELIEALANASLDAFLLVSTGEVYGRQPGPFHEGLPVHPMTAYGAAKAAAEAIVLGAMGSAGLPGTIARMSVVYGPGPWGRAKESSASGMLIQRLIASAIANMRFPMTSGDQTRDFLYVDDAARALVALADSPNARGQIVNVGSGVSHPVGEVARRLLAELGNPIPLELGAVPHAPGEIMDYRFDTTRLRALTGFEPAWSLEEGLRATARAG